MTMKKKIIRILGAAKTVVRQMKLFFSGRKYSQLANFYDKIVSPKIEIVIIPAKVIFILWNQKLRRSPER